MARYNSHHDVESIYRIVDLWRTRSLLGDQALLTDEASVSSAEQAVESLP